MVGDAHTWLEAGIRIARPLNFPAYSRETKFRNVTRAVFASSGFTLIDRGEIAEPETISAFSKAETI